MEQLTRPKLESLALSVVAILGQRLMDPHLYFEQKYRARIETCRSCDELHAVLDELLQWIVAGQFDAKVVAEIDEALAVYGLATLARSAFR